jgi:hypothetical protein
MASTVHRALSRRLREEEVTKLIVDFTGEFTPPGVSKRDWRRILACGDRRARPSHVVRSEVEAYTRVIGEGKWYYNHWYDCLCRDFRRVNVLQLLRREFMGFPELLTRLEGSGLEVDVTVEEEYPGEEPIPPFVVDLDKWRMFDPSSPTLPHTAFQILILEVDHRGHGHRHPGAFRFPTCPGFPDIWLHHSYVAMVRVRVECRD